MATHMVIVAAHVSKRGLRDCAPRTQAVATVYNTDACVSGDPAFAGRRANYQVSLLASDFHAALMVDGFFGRNEF